MRRDACLPTNEVLMSHVGARRGKSRPGGDPMSFVSAVVAAFGFPLTQTAKGGIFGYYNY